MNVPVTSRPASCSPGHIVSTTLPVPPLGAVLDEEGDAYVRSLLIRFWRVDAQHLDVKGNVFEDLMTAIGLRHLTFHPRTREVLAGAIRTETFISRIERNWSGVESMGNDAVELANDILAWAKTYGGIHPEVVWHQAN